MTWEGGIKQNSKGEYYADFNMIEKGRNPWGVGLLQWSLEGNINFWKQVYGVNKSKFLESSPPSEIKEYVIDGKEYVQGSGKPRYPKGSANYRWAYKELLSEESKKVQIKRSVEEYKTWLEGLKKQG